MNPHTIILGHATRLLIAAVILADILTLADFDPFKMVTQLPGLALVTLLSVGPLLVSLFLAFSFKKPFSISLLMISTVFYGLGLGYLYLTTPAPDELYGLLCGGLYSLPVLIPVWVIAIWKRKSPVCS